VLGKKSDLVANLLTSATVLPQRFVHYEAQASANVCIHTLFEQQVERTPQACALVADGEVITYTQLNRRANRLAHYLRDLGVKPGVLVGICVERSPEMIIAVYAVLKAGGAYVPLDPTYPKDRTRYMVEHAGIKLLITREGLLKALPVGQFQTVVIDTGLPEIAQQPDRNPASSVRPDDRVYAIYTSGSTGKPKLAAVSHRGFTNLLNWFVGEFQIGSSDRTLLVSSFNFDLTQKNIYAPLITGGELHLYVEPQYEPELIRDFIERRGITLINWTPSAFNPLLDGGDASFTKLRSLRIVFLGGEPIALPPLKQWASSRDFNAEFANTYGPTECTDICVFHRFGRSEILGNVPIPLGKPIWNARVYVLGSNLEALPPGEIGELCVGGIGVGEGYINNPALTAEKFVLDPFVTEKAARLYKTGDLASYLPDGTFQFRGRIDNQVKIRGFRIELEEIERALADHPRVSKVALAARNLGANETNQGASLEQQLVAYIVPASGQVVSSRELREFLSRTLPDYMIPSRFVNMAELPQNSNGKLDRKALPSPTSENALDAASHRAPDSPIAVHLASILCELLSLERVGMDDNFFHLGGHSMLSAQLIVRIRRKFGVQLMLRDLFQAQTPAKLAERIERDLVANLEKMTEEEAQRLLAGLEQK